MNNIIIINPESKLLLHSGSPGTGSLALVLLEHFKEVIADMK